VHYQIFYITLQALIEDDSSHLLIIVHDWGVCQCIKQSIRV